MKHRSSNNRRISLDLFEDDIMDRVQLMQPSREDFGSQFHEQQMPGTPNRKIEERDQFSWRKAFEIDVYADFN